MKKRVTTALKHTTYVNHLGQSINIQQKIDADRVIKKYEKHNHFWSQIQPNQKARK